MKRVYLFLNEDSTYTIFYVESAIPEYLKSDVIEADIPEVEDGVLRRAEDGTFYFEQFPIVPTPEPEPEPIPPVETSIEKRLEQIELTSAYTQLQVDYVAFLTEILTTQPK
ncbi:hypothetical protein [Lysinibacillus sp. FSL W8-0992]|uniref:hypothetical protein n=1 Tax=Lysinibacillus sp. FSL W8-0992 TaxID=2954643 RepID=UPI0030F7D3EC